MTKLKAIGMKTDDFMRLIAEPETVDGTHAADLKELTERYPYFSQARVLYLRSLQKSQSIHFESQIGITTLYASDRNWLYFYLYPEARLSKTSESHQRDARYSGSYFDLLEAAESEGEDTRVSLKKIAERWTHLTGQSVSVDDLLLYAVQDGLEIGVEVESWHMRRYNKQDPLADTTTSVKNGYVALPVNIVSEFRFKEELLVTHIESADKLILTYVDTPHWSRQASEQLSNELFRAKDYENGLPKFFNPKIHKNELIINLEERNRFEQSFRHGDQGAEEHKSKNQDRLDPRKEKTYLQLIRLMDAECNLPSEPFKAAEGLMEAAATRGLTIPSKKDTIAEKLQAARNLPD